MNGWNKVKWTEARQILQGMDLEEERLTDPDVDPRSFFNQLREAGKGELAIRYLGQALPRYEAVGWAALGINAQASAATLGPIERQALDHSLRWVEEPTDGHRRAAQEAAERAKAGSAEWLLGQAVLLSGGSIAPPDLAAVIPPHATCGNLASAALLVACHRDLLPDKAVSAMLDAGDKVAASGLEALRSA